MRQIVWITNLFGFVNSAASRRLLASRSTFIFLLASNSWPLINHDVQTISDVSLPLPTVAYVFKDAMCTVGMRCVELKCFRTVQKCLIKLFIKIRKHAERHVPRSKPQPLHNVRKNARGPTNAAFFNGQDPASINSIQDVVTHLCVMTFGRYSTAVNLPEYLSAFTRIDAINLHVHPGCNVYHHTNK